MGSLEYLTDNRFRSSSCRCPIVNVSNLGNIRSRILKMFDPWALAAICDLDEAAFLSSKQGAGSREGGCPS